jgi:monomeric isocitrate dehydrogenase
LICSLGLLALGTDLKSQKGPILRPFSYSQNLFGIVKSGCEGVVMSIIPLCGSNQEESTILPQNCTK